MEQIQAEQLGSILRRGLGSEEVIEFFIIIMKVVDNSEEFFIEVTEIFPKELG